MGDIGRVGFSGFLDFLLSAVVSLTLQGKFAFIFSNSFRVSGFNSFHQCCFFLFLNLCGSFRLFLLLSQLLGFDGGNAFFFGNSFNRGIVVADEVEINVDILLTVNGATTCGFVDFHSVNKGIEHGVRQFLAVSVLVD